MSNGETQRAVATVPEGWTPDQQSRPTGARQARPDRSPGIAPGRAAQGPRGSALRRRVRDGGHGLRGAAIQHDRPRTHHHARHERRRGSGRSRARHDLPQRAADATPALVPDRAQGGRRRQLARDAGRQHPLERRTGRDRPGRDTGAGRLRRFADRGGIRVVAAANLRGGAGHTRGRPTVSWDKPSRCWSATRRPH